MFSQVRVFSHLNRRDFLDKPKRHGWVGVINQTRGGLQQNTVTLMGTPRGASLQESHSAAVEL